MLEAGLTVFPGIMNHPLNCLFDPSYADSWLGVFISKIFPDMDSKS